MKYIFLVLTMLVYCIATRGQTILASGPTTFCTGGNVTLTIDPATGISYQWISNNTNITGATNSSYIASANGSYTVKLSRISLPDTTIGPIVVIVNSNPIITVNSPSVCIGQSAKLTASGADTYTWSPATNLNPTTGPTVTASTSATTTYTVTGTDSLTHCSATANATVTINAYPTANFTFSPTGQCSNLPILFTNTSTGGSTYSWDFGDINSGNNNSSTLPNPFHTFIGATGDGSQTFNVTQTVTNAGCSNTKTITVTTTQVADGKLGGTGEVTYNGQIYFTTCGLTSGDFTFTNQSSTLATNTNYQLVWGDGSPDFNSNSFSSTTHTFSVGNHAIFFIVKGKNGCIDTTKYSVFVGTNPAVGLNNPGNTLACSGESLTFPITGVATNAPGTVYTVTFNDGTPPIIYIHPDIPTSITHTFNTTSCGTTSSNGTNSYANSFSANILAQNPCNSSAATVVPIYISKKPKASFTITPSDTVCVNTVVTFTNTSASDYVSNGTCKLGNSIWSVSPAVGWNIVSGNLGNDFGLTDPAVWQSGSTQLLLNFSSPGIYTIKIKTGNTNCGTDSIAQTVCVTIPPTPSFSLNNSAGCIPLNVTATNTTTSLSNCGPPTYFWSVTYSTAFCGTSSSWSFGNGSSATSTDPLFVFSNPGIYTVELAVTNACGTFRTTQTVNVKQPPLVTISLPSYPCGPVTVKPIANVTSCGTGALTYAWTFDGGVPGSSTAADPGPITFSAPGSHIISLAVTNECGTTSAVQTVIVTASPDVVVPANQNKCGGETVGPLNFSSTVGIPVYNWTNSNPSIGLPSSGTDNIPSFTAINNGTNPLTATITVAPFVSAACIGIPASFTITVNPRPAAPLAATPLIYCLNATAAPLTATADPGNTLTWYNNPALTGGAITAPMPGTSIAGNTLFYVTQTNSFFCTSTANVIDVTVNPSISGNTIATDQNICANTVPAPLTSLNSVGGGSGNYIYLWQSSTDGGTNWTDINGTNNEFYSPPVLLATVKYRRIINSATCADTSNIVTITVQGALANYNIAANQIICEGQTPAVLTGGLPTGGGGSYTYLWESSTDNINWATTGNTDQDYQPTSLLQTTYFRRKVFASQCNAVSNTDTISVNPTPNGRITTIRQSVCEYDSADITFEATAGTAPFNIRLKILGPGGTDTVLQSFNNNGPATIKVIPANSIPGTYTVVLTRVADSKICERTGDISTLSITVKPKPVLITSAAPTICSGNSTPIIVNGADSYSWSPSVGLSSTMGSAVTANPTITTTYIITGTLDGCVNTAPLTVTVTPGATVATTGPSQLVCNVPVATLSANAALIGTGAWRQLSGPATVITDSLKSNTSITGLVGGQRYIFTWVITGLPPCPPTSANDTIDVLSDIINTIQNDTVICSGQPVLLQTQNISGGNTNDLNAQYTYQWEAASPGQSNWLPVGGAIDASLAVSPAISTCYHRLVRSNNSCETISNTVCISVNPNITNNFIGDTQQVCVNVIPALLTGATPAGGDNNYFYQWQTGTDGINWMDVGNDISYQPPAYLLAGIHYYRRNVTSGNCTSVSNIITITVRPDSKAIFTINDAIDCAPFDLAKSIKVTVLPDSNGLYQWYADGILFDFNNTGTFPGYTILNPDDTILIKLRTTSLFGCKPDSIEQQFITVTTAFANFTKDTGFGCGPLTVAFVNTSSILNGTKFFWDFGNGDTSSKAQPDAVTFISSPFYSDTTYQVSLKAYNGCDTTKWTDSVKIRANPKARFGVDTTFGCSPFTITIDNNSLGGPNTYYWDFGNGVTDTTFANSIFDFTYNTGNTVDTFTIRLIAENECNRDTQSINIRVAPNPIRPRINVNSSELFGCIPHTVTFNNNTFGATSFVWNFGDSTPVIITNNNQSTIEHTYRTAGIFIVSIAITNGCSDTTVFRKVTVFPKPVADFTTNAFVCAGDTVKVSNTLQDAITYRWFWDDGTSDTGPQPTHIFNTSGSYNVVLYAERNDSTGLVCMDTIVRPVTVLAKPVVTVQSNINAINCTPFTLKVSAPGITNEKVTWYIYDSTVTPSINISDSISAQYTFNKPGSFYVRLVAINARGCTDSITIPFTVRGKAVASFTPGDLSICTRDTTISYRNTSTYNGTDLLGYQWLVNGVRVSTDGNFIHQYTVLPAAILPRLFSTSLIVSNTVGCSDTATATLQMNPLAQSQFSITNPNDCVPFLPGIVNTSAYTTTYHWLLNGRPVGDSANPNITINQSAQLYNITLIADNIYGCKPDTFSVEFTSRAKPMASFTLSDTLGCTGSLNILTNNQTTGPNANTYSYIWNWGDGTPEVFFKNSSHQYTGIGQYLIQLVASDGVCRDTTAKLVKVSNKPVVDFSVDQIRTCDTARVNFTNLTTNGVNFQWSFGDGTFSTQTNPSKFYPPALAPYTVKLVAKSDFGCKDSAVKPNLVLAVPPPASDFLISPSPVIAVPDYTFAFDNLTLNSPGYKYQWSLGDGDFAPTRDVTHKYADTGSYLVRLIVLDTSTGCTDTTSKIARIGGNPGYLYVTNAFYPNSIRNEFKIFKPLGKGLADYQLQVFDSWGKLLFETRLLDAAGSPSVGWDGTYNGVPVAQDTYAWKIKATFRSGKPWDGMVYTNIPGKTKGVTFGTVILFR